MNDKEFKVDEYIYYGNYITVFIIFIWTSFCNVDSLYKGIFFISLFVISMASKEIFIYRMKGYNKMKVILSLLDLLLVFIMSFYLRGYIHLFLYVVSIFSVLVHLHKRYTIIHLCTSYIFYTISALVRTNGKTQITTFIMGTIIFIVLCFIVNLIINIISMYEEKIKDKLVISEKNLVLLEKNRELTNAFNEIEELIVNRERTRIARDIHDVVGHKLTSALMELKAIDILYKKNENVENRIKNVVNQVRECLSDTRIAVKSIKEYGEIDYYKELIKLLENSKEVLNVNIRYRIDNISKEKKEVLRLILRIVQESITNGIKHGNATAFFIEIIKEDYKIVIEIIDNGIGAADIKKGFGLKNIDERVTSLGGEFEIESKEGEGTKLKAILLRDCGEIFGGDN